MAPKLPTRALGRNGPQVTAIGFGTMGLSIAYGAAPSDEERLNFLDKAYEMGETFWDSSDIYGDSEDLLGQWFKRSGKRDEIFLATKFAITPDSDKDGNRVVRNEPEYIRQSVEKSLKRLGVDSIDLYYCHRLSGTVPVEDVVGTMAEFVKSGKVKHIGLSECSATSLRRAHAVHPIAAVQMEYSPFALDIEYDATKLLETARELGVAVVAYSPLGRGIMTGQIKSRSDFEEGDFRLYAPRFGEDVFDNNLKLVHQMDEIAKKKGVTSGQLTLAWLLAQGDDIIPIPGTKKIKYLEENLGAFDVKLSPEEVKEIRQIVDGADVQGERYPAAMMNSLFMDTVEKK